MFQVSRLMYNDPCLDACSGGLGDGVYLPPLSEEILDGGFLFYKWWGPG